MADAVGLGHVERARDAVAREDWQQAFDLLLEAEVEGLLAPAELALLGEVAYAAGHLDAAIEAWERAHARYLQGGDLVAAAGAGVRVAMHLLFDTALMAPVRGWLVRVERLLEGLGETPAHAWLAVVRAYERVQAGTYRCEIAATSPLRFTAPLRNGLREVLNGHRRITGLSRGS
jgi:hypothetical protein